MRVNRFEWLGRFFGLHVKHGERATRSKEKATRRTERKWIIMGRPYLALTKSEARAMAKKVHGALPTGTIIVAA